MKRLIYTLCASAFLFACKGPKEEPGTESVQEEQEKVNVLL